MFYIIQNYTKNLILNNFKIVTINLYQIKIFLILSSYIDEFNSNSCFSIPVLLFQFTNKFLQKL